MTLFEQTPPRVDDASLHLINARIVLPDRVADGAVHVRAGRIRAIDTGAAAGSAQTIDFSGDYLLPGLVEVHTDNLEKHLMPRSGVLWPALPALLTHDAQLLAAGITTALAALALGDLEEDEVRTATLADTVSALDSAMRQQLLRIEHYLHLRCELAYPQLMELLAPLVGHARVRLVSVMDHTPGQRQYWDTAQYRRYYARTGIVWDDADFAQLLTTRIAQQKQYRDAHLAGVLALVGRHRLALATHDDTEPAHIDEAQAIGASIAEFPVTLATARAARAAGLAIVAGAPNLVRGGSHSGNVAAIELAKADCLDILSSDYVPASLLHGAFVLHEQATWDLPRAIASVTRTPARALGLDDRGEIGEGLRADLVRVRLVDGLPAVQAVWLRGERVF